MQPEIKHLGEALHRHGTQIDQQNSELLNQLPPHVLIADVDEGVGSDRSSIQIWAIEF